MKGNQLLMETKELLKKVKKIEIKTRRLSNHLFSGHYHSSFKGRGVTFSEVRPYQYGDDFRAIDWNVTARNTEYVKKILDEKKLAEGKAIQYNNNKPANDTAKKVVVFQNEFADELPDTTVKINPVSAPQQRQSSLAKSKLFDYRLKFSSDYLLGGFSNNVLINRYQPYAGGAGPIRLNNGNDFNFTFRVGVSDLMEDVKFVGKVNRIGKP